MPTLRSARWTDQWSFHRLRQSEENYCAVAAEAGGQRLVWHFLETGLFRQVPVVRHPDIAGGINRDVRDDLQAANVAASESRGEAACRKLGQADTLTSKP